MFTGRQRKIIELIAGSVQGIYSAKLAEALVVSSRTVRNEIQAINTIWRKECRIHSSNQYGYYFDDRDIPFVRDYLFHNKERDSFEESNRGLSLLGLLIQRDHMNLYDAAEELFLSAQSIIREVNKLKAYLLQEYQLPAVILKGEEILLTIQEEDRRKLMLRIIKDEMVRTSFEQTPVIKDLLQDDYDQIEFTYITKLIEDYFMRQQISMTDDTLIMIAAAIYICYIRNLNHHLIQEIHPYETDETVERLLDAIVASNIMITQQDKPLLHDFLHIFKMNSEIEELKEIDDFSIRIFDEFCNDILDKYGFDLRSSSQLYHNMLIHIEYMIRRLKSSYELLNPIIKDVKKNFPFSYEMSMLIVPIVYKYLNKFIQDDEISYIAIYLEHFVENVNQKLVVALIATPRRSVMNIIEQWLQTHFVNQIEIVELSGQQALLEYEQKASIDFMVTLSDFILHPSIPVYRISDFPQEADQKQLAAMIKKIRINYRFKDILGAIFEDELIHIYDEQESFESVMKKTSLLLKQQEKIEDDQAFYEDILLREVNYPTFLNDHFMIPHPLATFAKKTAVAVSIMKSPLSMQQREIKIIFTLAIERKQNDDINVLFQFFKQIALRKEAMEAIYQVDNAKELMATLLQLSTML